MSKEAKTSVKNLFQNLKETLNENPTIPLQTVTPMKKSRLQSEIKISETPFTLYMPTAILKKLKVKAATDGVSIKELINNAVIKEYEL
jgi:hypothetical protein